MVEKTIEVKDALGNRMKNYELAFTKHRIDNTVPVYARLDGRAFSKFTKGLARPYDSRMSECMIDVTEFLVAETKANLGYTQSDEISLMWLPKENQTSQFLFDGKIQKLTSVLASMCSAKFFSRYMQLIGEPKTIPSFDCRILNIPGDDILNMFVWRQQDAQRNAIQMAAHFYLGHSKMFKMSTWKAVSELQTQFGVNFNDYPDFFKCGTYVSRQKVLTELSESELNRIPEQHRPTGPVERTILVKSSSLPSKGFNCAVY